MKTAKCDRCPEMNVLLPSFYLSDKWSSGDLVTSDRVTWDKKKILRFRECKPNMTKKTIGRGEELLPKKSFFVK